MTTFPACVDFEIKFSSLDGVSCFRLSFNPQLFNFSRQKHKKMYNFFFFFYYQLERERAFLFLADIQTWLWKHKPIKISHTPLPSHQLKFSIKKIHSRFFGKLAFHFNANKLVEAWKCYKVQNCKWKKCCISWIFVGWCLYFIKLNKFESFFVWHLWCFSFFTLRCTFHD